MDAGYVKIPTFHHHKTALFQKAEFTHKNGIGDIKAQRGNSKFSLFKLPLCSNAHRRDNNNIIVIQLPRLGSITGTNYRENNGLNDTASRSTGP